MSVSLFAEPYDDKLVVCDPKECYTFLDEERTWSDAKGRCDSLGQHLLDVDQQTLKHLGKRVENKICGPLTFWKGKDKTYIIT